MQEQPIKPNQKGMSGALRVAFTGGSVLGLTVVGLGLFGLIVLFFIFFTVFGGYSDNILTQYGALKNAIQVVTGYGLGCFTYRVIW